MKARNGFVSGGPLILLRLEGVAVFMAAILIYAHLGLAWWVFAGLILLPDASMLGYLASARVGAFCYNAVHTETAPVLLMAAAYLVGSSLTLSLSAIWLAHIGVDHMLGYGLKYASSFADTHLGALGRKRGVGEMPDAATRVLP
jgi:hypothetical protein